jgi:uncharacterized protein YkwD
MRRLRLAATFLAATSLALAAAPAYADDPAATDTTCVGADLMPAVGNLDQVGQATLCLLNLERAANSLPPLQGQGQLSQASTAYSARMVAEQFFDHVSPDGKTLVDRLTAVGYLSDSVDTWAAGENIAWGTGSLATPRSIVQAWMNSPPHRENILDTSFREIGLGVAVGVPQQDAGDGATYTTDFGVRELAAPAAAASAPRAAAPTRAAARRTRVKRAAAGRRAAGRAAARRAAARRARRARIARCTRAAHRAGKRGRAARLSVRACVRR